MASGQALRIVVLEDFALVCYQGQGDAPADCFYSCSLAVDDGAAKRSSQDERRQTDQKGA